MGVCGYSWAGEPTAGDFGGETEGVFVDFLKNLDRDLLGGGGCCGADGEPLKVAEEGKEGRVAGREEDCGESVSFWGNRKREKRIE